MYKYSFEPNHHDGTITLSSSLGTTIVDPATIGNHPAARAAEALTKRMDAARRARNWIKLENMLHHDAVKFDAEWGTSADQKAAVVAWYMRTVLFPEFRRALWT